MLQILRIVRKEKNITVYNGVLLLYLFVFFLKVVNVFHKYQKHINEFKIENKL